MCNKPIILRSKIFNKKIMAKRAGDRVVLK